MFDAWIAFRRGESQAVGLLICCECQRVAEGDAAFPNGDQLCNACADENEKFVAALPIKNCT